MHSALYRPAMMRVFLLLFALALTSASGEDIPVSSDLGRAVWRGFEALHAGETVGLDAVAPDQMKHLVPYAKKFLSMPDPPQLSEVRFQPFLNVVEMNVQ